MTKNLRKRIRILMNGCLVRHVNPNIASKGEILSTTSAHITGNRSTSRGIPTPVSLGMVAAAPVIDNSQGPLLMLINTRGWRSLFLLAKGAGNDRRISSPKTLETFHHGKRRHAK